MDGPIYELGVGRLAVPAAEVRSGHLESIGLYDQHRALQCLGDIPTGITASLTATWPPEPGPGRTELHTEVLATGTVTAYRTGRCVNFVSVQPSDGAGLDRNALGGLRGRRVRLDLHLVITICECSRQATAPEGTMP